MDDPAYARESVELDRLSLQLSLIVRDLKSKANSLNLQEQKLWSIPRADRFKAAASVHGQQLEVEQVRKQAIELQALLEKLIERSGLLHDGELADGFAKAIEQFAHQAHISGEAQGIPDQLSYVPASKTELNGSLEGITIMVFAALSALRYLKKRNQKK